MAETQVEVGEGLLAETFTRLRRCGAGRRECVVYLSGLIDRPGLLDRVHHPDHSASAAHYEIDPAWLDQTWRRLAHERRELRVQIHTHGSLAFHSPTDDGFPIVQTPGFLSLVIARFALGPVGLQDTYLAELDVDGAWREVDPLAAIEISR